MSKLFGLPRLSERHPPSWFFEGKFKSWGTSSLVHTFQFVPQPISYNFEIFLSKFRRIVFAVFGYFPSAAHSTVTAFVRTVKCSVWMWWVRVGLCSCVGVDLMLVCRFVHVLASLPAVRFPQIRWSQLKVRVCVSWTGWVTSDVFPMVLWSKDAVSRRDQGERKRAVRVLPLC